MRKCAVVMRLSLNMPNSKTVLHRIACIKYDVQEFFATTLILRIF